MFKISSWGGIPSVLSIPYVARHFDFKASHIFVVGDALAPRRAGILNVPFAFTILSITPNPKFVCIHVLVMP